MKTIIYLSMYIALTAFASCSENSIDEEPALPHPTARTFKVSLGAEAPGTRTSLDEETGAMTWVDGDAISLHVVDKSGVVLQENRKFMYNAETHTFEGEFTSHPEIIDWEGDRYTACEWYAYYPYSPNHTSNTIFGTIPTVQLGGKVSTGGYNLFGKNYDFMISNLTSSSYAESADGIVLPAGGINLRFQKSKVTIIRLTIPALSEEQATALGIPAGEQVTRIEMAAAGDGGYYISGDFECEKTFDEYPTFTHVTARSGENYVTWYATSETDRIDVSKGGCIYFVVNGTDSSIAAGKFRIRIITTNGEMLQSSTKSMSLTPGALKKMAIKWNGWSTIRNLSASGSANCYVVKPGGSYKFKTSVRGNGVDTRYKTSATEYATIKGNFTEQEILAQKRAQLIWEVANTTDATDASQDTNVIDGAPVYSGDGYITFKTGTAGGNAVIAIVDNNNTVLWSWHIWSTEDAEAIINCTAITPTTKMMDRNLGAGRNANSAVKTNSTSVDFEDRGLFYQWGRKDPFIYNFNIEGARPGDGTGWELFSQSAIPAEAEAAAIAYCIAHPSKYMPRKDALAKDWFTNNRNISRGNRLWNGGILTNESAEAYKQSARETVDANKSVFDPCPPGYRMPISGIWGKTNNDTSELVGSWRHYLGNWMKNSSGRDINGGYFIEEGNDSFYPSVSALQENNTSFNNDSPMALRYWTASLNAQTANDSTGKNTSYYGGTVWITSKDNQPFNFAPKSDARPVRCVQIDYFTSQIYEK